MKNKTYIEKLKDPRWQKKRLEVLERDGWKCMCCGEKKTTLHIHHIFYLPKKEPWEIHNGFLITLCEKCHKPSCEYGPCEQCEDFSLDKNNTGRCEGPGMPTTDIQECIGILLNNIWKDDTIGDFYSSIGMSILKLNEGNR